MKPMKEVDKSISARLEKVRTCIGLKKKPFAESVGYGHSGYSLVERGINNATPQLLNAICNKYRVNLNWLKTGTGDMFDEDQDPVAKICAQFGLTEQAIKIVERFLTMDSADREQLINLVRQLVDEKTS